MARKKVEKEELEELEEIEDVEEVEEEEEKEVEETVDSVNEEEEYKELTVEERITNLEKKSNVILCLVACVLAICLITMISVLNNGTSNSQDTETSNTSSQEQASNNSYDTSAFKTIKGSDIASESKDKTIAVMIGRQGCGYCAAYAPILTKLIQDTGITIHYIDLLGFLDISTNPAKIVDQASFDAINSLQGAKGVSYTGADALRGTPATLIIKDNKIVDFISGYTEEANIKQALTNAGMIK